MTKPTPHYSPFGSLIPNRYWSDASRVYRYGFNGKEKDFETSSDNYDFGARIYDGRLGRWLSVDPLMKIYPSSSPYLGNGNSPIWLIDIDGCRILIQSIAQIGNINYSSCYEYRDGKLYSQNP
ncbi:MAG: hypothetical protein JNM67_05470, partial [Bacteroidetes bacterium]|nr:hypothetical protein [Bacteroidota bacterium]